MSELSKSRFGYLEEKERLTYLGSGTINRQDEDSRLVCILTTQKKKEKRRENFFFPKGMWFVPL